MVRRLFRLQGAVFRPDLFHHQHRHRQRLLPDHQLHQGRHHRHPVQRRPVLRRGQGGGQWRHPVRVIHLERVMDYAALRAAILSGPLAAQCAPYAILPDAPKDPDFVTKDQAIADILNAGTETVLRPLRVEELFDVLFASGDWVAIETARLGGNQTAVLCQAVLSSAKALGPGLVDLAAPATIALLDQLHQGGLLSQAGRDALAVRASSTVPSSVKTYGRLVTGADVSIALRNIQG